MADYQDVMRAEAAAERLIRGTESTLAEREDGKFKGPEYDALEAAGIPVTDGTKPGASDDEEPGAGASGPFVSAGEASIFPPIDKDHPLARAARETNDKAMAEGLEATLSWLGIGDAGELAYLAEQRALRAIASTTGVVMGEDAEQDEVVARAVVETPLWKDMRLLLIGCYLDGIAIGWRGRQIADDTPDHFEGNLGANIAGGRAGDGPTDG